MPEKVAGLPAHPLIIHLPLILGPLVGLLALLLLVPKLREKLLLPTAGLSVLFAVSAVLAVMSGQDFAKIAGGPGLGEHADAAKTLRMLSIILAALLVVFALGRKKVPAVAATGLAVVVAALGVATVAFTIDTGHKGAELVWGDIGEQSAGEDEGASSGQDEAPAAETASDDGASSGSGGSGSDDDMPADHGEMTAEEHRALENP